MNKALAYQMIADQLGWTDAELAEEFAELQLMIDHKYDKYHGFQPATRFHVALLGWLSQFDTVEKKKTVYRLLKERLIYVSQVEMHHLVSLLMPIVDRHSRRRVADQQNIPLYKTWTSPVADARVKLMLKRTLYVGLSDGARMDVFRRYNEGAVSNEQVVAFSEISKDKWDDLVDEMSKRLNGSGEAAQFEAVCLIDDFSGSGSSLLRWNDSEKKWGGKVWKFYKANKEKVGAALAKNCVLHIHHHLASDQAKHQITQDVARFAAEYPDFQYEVTFSHVLPSSIVINDSDNDTELTDLLKAWYDSGIEDKHTGPDIWYGYKQCGLPLILEHNTPNNSVALLWATSDADGSPLMKPLFARRKRHSSNQAAP